MGEVNIELYEILKESECHLREDLDGKVIAWACINHYSLKDFCESLSCDYFDDSPLSCFLYYDGSISIELNGIMSYEGHKLSSYGKCFEEWDKYKDKVLKFEKVRDENRRFTLSNMKG